MAIIVRVCFFRPNGGLCGASRVYGGDTPRCPLRLVLASTRVDSVENASRKHGGAETFLPAGRTRAVDRASGRLIGRTDAAVIGRWDVRRAGNATRRRGSIGCVIDLTEIAPKKKPEEG